MGDLRAWSPEPNFVVVEERPSSSSPVPLPSSNQTEYWKRAEAVTERIIAKIQPTVVSEERRKAVIDYVQRLIRNSVGCEVFPFGSVPLKTYLPDGDIDLTAFGGINLEEAMAHDVCSVLESEDHNRDAEFVVKDVQLIRAEVKLVKCLVQNIVVDISFNQLGGLCTLCFLEQVDRLIGKHHLFKRSIILIKAWCYYESRILGAHHGLISTYALETLVLYIFNFFHSSLNGPLAVLYKFLDYFSKFDWDNYCISLNGPVRISSLPEVVVETSMNGDDLLLSNDFIKECVEMFSVPGRGFENFSRTFPLKHLNIVDPLRENNNLGRSVSKGNFYRIRSAFTYGARKLGRIVSHPDQNVTDEVSEFFSNTLDRHGCGQRPDVQDPITMDGQYRFCSTMPFSGREFCQEERTSSESISSGIAGETRLEDEQHSHVGDNIKLSGKDLGSRKIVIGTQNGPAISEKRLSGDAKDRATSRIQSLSIPDDAFKPFSPALAETISPGRVFHRPHLYFSSSVKGNEDVRNENSELKQSGSSDVVTKRVPSGVLPGPHKETATAVCCDLDDSQLLNSCEVAPPVESIHHPLHSSLASCSPEGLHPGQSNIQASGTSGSSEALNYLVDLSGDFESHLNNLHCGQWWNEYGCNAHLHSVSPTQLTQFKSKNLPLDVVRQSAQIRRSLFPELTVNGVLPRPLFYQVNPPLLHGASIGVEEISKPRGTGTYFPNLNYYRDRPAAVRGRNPAPKSPRNNANNISPKETNLVERNSRESSQLQFHNHQGVGKSGTSNHRHPVSPEAKPYANGSVYQSERGFEFGSAGHQPFGFSSLESSKLPNRGPTATNNASVSLQTITLQKPKPVLARDQQRIAEQSYQLKDEDDFPPLSDSSGKGSPCTIKKLQRPQE
ncbi:hypothetical protein K2173_000056 [Erythroxylum novogranatense]|uniref:PAP/OAS1 substrate-binding domain superfamily n=1 Tax=Erythroxylum novogranatense TaxID=1862640 RepID=A0AAV8SNB5_9ROSI|nr:hypothetical protein K2173_000056 [Erythroxylum novogranatense]